MAVVIDPGTRADRDGPRPYVLTADRHARRLSLVDFPTPVGSITRVKIPRNFNGRDPQSRRDLASTLRNRTHNLTPPPPGKGRRRRRSVAGGGPPHRGPAAAGCARTRATRCPDREDHARWAERYFKLDRDAKTLKRRIEQRTNTIARQFDRVCDVLTALDYLEGDGDASKVTDRGRTLMRIYNEMDLLTAECAARRAVGRARRLRPGGGALDAGLRVAAPRRRRRAAPPRRPGQAGARRHGLDLVRPRRPRARPPPRPAARARPRLRVGRLPLGRGRRARRHPARHRSRRRATSSAGSSSSSTSPTRWPTPPATPGCAGGPRDLEAAAARGGRLLLGQRVALPLRAARSARPGGVPRRGAAPAAAGCEGGPGPPRPWPQPCSWCRAAQPGPAPRWFVGAADAVLVLRDELQVPEGSTPGDHLLAGHDGRAVGPGQPGRGRCVVRPLPYGDVTVGEDQAGARQGRTPFVEQRCRLVDGQDPRRGLRGRRRGIGTTEVAPLRAVM